MRHPSLFLVVTFWISFGSYPGLWAQETQPTPVQRQPIVCKWTTLDGMNYYLGGDKVTEMKKLQPILSALHDPETDRLAALSNSSQDSGTVFLIGGTVLLIGGVASIGSDTNSGGIDAQQAAGIVGVLLGLGGDYVGAFKLEESLTSKFAAVQRYNAVVHGEDLSYLPPSSQPAFQAQLLALQF